MPLSIGSSAPDVTLYTKASDKVEPMKVSDFRGKKNVVLLFFPAVYTGTCTTEMCTIRDTMKDYDALNAEVIGISSDLPHAQLAWKQHLNLNMTLASDSNHDAVKAYDVEYPTFWGGLHGIAKRSAFIIDKEGVLRYAEVLENAGSLPHFDAIQAALKGLS
jgi:peroxiredoxin